MSSRDSRFLLVLSMVACMCHLPAALLAVCVVSNQHLLFAQVHLFIDKSLSRLKGSDRTLPQILRLRQMLKRGLGVHHAGAPV